MLTVGKLREFMAELDDDTEIRFASQPSWPFEYSIDKYSILEFSKQELGEADNVKFPEEARVLYLSEGHQIGYLPGIVQDALGW